MYLALLTLLNNYHTIAITIRHVDTPKTVPNTCSFKRRTHVVWGNYMFDARSSCFTLIQVVQIHYAIGTITLR